LQGNRDTFPSQRSAPLRRSKQPITMSNAAVGHVYDTIIAEVVNAVRVDFEENGVDEGALEDLKKVRLLQIPLCPRHCSLGLVLPPSPTISHLLIFPSIPIKFHFEIGCRCILLCTFLPFFFFFSSDRFPLFGVDGTSQSRDECRALPRRLPLAPRGAGERGWRAAGPGGRPSTFGSLFKGQPNDCRRPPVILSATSDWTARPASRAEP
jgi:hypothetical protein